MLVAGKMWAFFWGGGSFSIRANMPDLPTAGLEKQDEQETYEPPEALIPRGFSQYTYKITPQKKKSPVHHSALVGPACAR